MTYSPNTPPVAPDEPSQIVLAWIYQELQNLQTELAETIALDLRPVFVAPKRPRDGMIVYADGTSWNPGSGLGVYAYENGSWVKL